MKQIQCISGNQKKINQYLGLQSRLAPGFFEFVLKPVEMVEIQSVDGQEVISAKMTQVRAVTKLPFIVDDVSLSVAGSAYPGALVKHVLKNNTYRSLRQFLPDQALVRLSCFIGYFDGFNEHVFEGYVDGVICYGGCDEDSIPGLDTLIRVGDTLLRDVDGTQGHRGLAFTQLIEYLRTVEMDRGEHNAEVMRRWDSRADEWQSVREDSGSYVNYEDGYVRFDAEVKRILPLVFGTAVDIGCGDGEVTRLIASNNSILTKITGIDLSQEMVRVAQGKTTDQRIMYISGTFTSNGEQYSLITSRGVVISHMHRSDVISTLSAMASALLPGGYLVFDYISNIENHDDHGRMPKNQLKREWITGVCAELGLVNVSFNGSDSHRVSILTFHKPTARSWYFATSNATKIIELQSKCPNHALHLANLDVSEIKNDDIVVIAKDKAQKSYEMLGHPVLVTDGGIFINALNGFPGPNSKQAATLLGPKKLLTLLDGEIDRRAIRRNCLVFYDGNKYRVCVAEVPLVISDRVTESEYPAYPMDAILVPANKTNAAGLTYKQMPVEERVQFTELPEFEKFIAELR